MTLSHLALSSAVLCLVVACGEGDEPGAVPAAKPGAVLGATDAAARGATPASARGATGPAGGAPVAGAPASDGDRNLNPFGDSGDTAAEEPSSADVIPATLH